jgi:flagellar motor switch protein FliN/FliY
MSVENMNKDTIEADQASVKVLDEAAHFGGEAEQTPAVSAEALSFDAILDVPVTLAMEFGRTQISIRDLLKLNQGSIVELDRLASEPLDILVNGTLVARGEVVVVNEKFGIRLTDIVSPSDRINRLA